MATTTVKIKPSEQLSARERLLAAADELFYEEGVHSVGIDRVLERAGVAKATLYSAFGSKDELVRAYLARRHEVRQARILSAIANFDTPRDQLLGIFDYLTGVVVDPGFRGCAFVNASAESKPGGAVEDVSNLSRTWTRALFTDLARAAGAAHPRQLARQLSILYDGATVSARMDRDPSAVASARAIAAMLLDASVKG